MADRPDRAGEPQNLFPLLSTRAASPLQAIQLNRRRDKRNRAVFLSIAAARRLVPPRSIPIAYSTMMNGHHITQL